jgi:hypothetical protein
MAVPIAENNPTIALRDAGSHGGPVWATPPWEGGLCRPSGTLLAKKPLPGATNVSPATRAGSSLRNEIGIIRDSDAEDLTQGIRIDGHAPAVPGGTGAVLVIDPALRSVVLG